MGKKKSSGKKDPLKPKKGDESTSKPKLLKAVKAKPKKLLKKAKKRVKNVVPSISHPAS